MGRLAVNVDHWGPIVGLAGSSVIALASLVTGLAYSGKHGEAYSPLNHWVSELGEQGVSQLATVFNIGLMVGGVCFVVFMSGLAMLRRNRLAWLYGALGAITGAAGFFVGVFPMNHPDQHGIAALTFFILGWLVVGLGSLDFYRARDTRFPGWLAVIGTLSVIAFVGFLVVLFPLIGGEGPAAPAVRPDVWIVPILEWCVLAGILSWVFATSFTWWRATR